MKLSNWTITVGILGLMLCFRGELPAVPAVAAEEPCEDLLAGHPRASYQNVKDIDAMEAALRESLAQRSSYSFSRGWWGWDRLRCRYSAAEAAFFLSVLVPYVPDGRPAEVAKTITTGVDPKGNAEATIGRVRVTVRADGNWAVQR